MSVLAYTSEKSHAKDRDLDRATMGQQPRRTHTCQSGALVRAVGEPKLSLAQKLASFDPDRHGGEVMPTQRVGREVF